MAASMQPAHCATTYMIASSTRMTLASMTPSVTAGLKWAPLM